MRDDAPAGRPAGPGFIWPNWPLPPRVRAAATTRRSPGHSGGGYAVCNLGLRSGDDPVTVRRNRAGLVAALDLPEEPLWLQQVHGADVLEAGAAPLATRAPGEEPVADAAVTRQPGRVLAVLGADCLPVLLASDDGAAVAAAHAGWRGLAAGVLENTVAAMACPSRMLSAWLGPAIGPECYEVGGEVRNAFVQADAGSAEGFHPVPGRSGHWHCDLYLLARRRLRAAGVARVHGGEHCTFRDAVRFHSYRRDGAGSGRQAALIWIGAS